MRDIELIATERLELLPLGVEHAAALHGVLDDPGLHTFIGGEPESREALAERYRRWSAGSPDPAERWLNWVIRLVAEDRLIGTVQATVHGTEAEVAWVVGAGWQGRGCAREAARALVGWLAGAGVRRVVAHVHPEHHASAAVAAAAGLTATERFQDGERRWELVLPTG
ncbi:GNAT family N-acetyltransferase [Kitasatospora sp. NPDC008050]|uniref:GNAT family N-acetyltransferase n=1 Tax=Kitasatospora sp. NPDC008050 TaxID=3364021 RepID=UPI0036E721ED